MKWLLAIALVCVGCGGSSNRVEDGGLIGQDGWPVRGLGEQRRCPAGSDLLDEQLPDGQRTITCKSLASPLPKGFLITWYPGGTLASESELDPDGRPQWRKTWHPDGALESEEVYEDGLVLRRVSFYSDGSEHEIMERTPTGALIKRLRPDGTVEAAGEIIGEHKAGEWQEWTEGAVETVSYEDGKKHGGALREYADGSKEEGAYDHGERDMNWKRVAANGQPILFQSYQNGKLVGERTAYFPTGNPREVSNYQDGQLHGTYRLFYPLGDTEVSGTYACGKKHGEWQEFHPDGALKAKGVYVAGRKSGEWTHYFPSGVVERVENHPIETGEPCPTTK